MDQHLLQHQEQRQQALPRLIEANHLLQLSSQSLESVIAQELMSNPALELIEARCCPRCGSVLEAERCPTCRDEPFTSEPEIPVIEHDSETYRVRREENGLDVDQFGLIATEMNVLEDIRSDAFATLPERDHRIASVIIEAIDERGWLALSTDEIRDLTGASSRRVEQVLKTVQSVAPAGVGARDLSECLRLQAAELSSQGIETPSLIAKLAEEDFVDLASQRYQRIAERRGSTEADVAEAHQFIRTQLTPNPLQDRSASHWRHADSTQRMTPDVIVRIVEDDIVVSLAKRNDARLAINEDYIRLSTLRRKRPQGQSLHLSDEEWEHVRSSLRSARDFMSKLEQRRRTLLKIAALVCERQEDFLRGTVRDLKPLTRSEIAAEIGVNESTVSRATAEKFVMLPNRRVVPFSDFFTASLGVKDVIKEIISTEAARGATLSDQRICDMLSERGFRIARRTVTKYRLQLDILPSTQRHPARV